MTTHPTCNSGSKVIHCPTDSAEVDLAVEARELVFWASCSQLDHWLEWRVYQWLVYAHWCLVQAHWCLR